MNNISRRDYFVIEILKMLSDNLRMTRPFSVLIGMSVKFADSLISELNESELKEKKSNESKS